jgi:alanine-glyoxylate transaminase/serine-glyoxylate transaminase/serine-pyruvate transaminase
MSLGSGLGRLAGTVFRIGHLGWFNDLMLARTLAGVQMGLRRSGVPVGADGLDQALVELQSG